MLEPREIGRNGGHFAVIGWNIASRLLVLASKAHLEGVAELGKHGELGQRSDRSLRALHQDSVETARRDRWRRPGDVGRGLHE